MERVAAKWSGWQQNGAGWRQNGDERLSSILLNDLLLSARLVIIFHFICATQTSSTFYLATMDSNTTVNKYNLYYHHAGTTLLDVIPIPASLHDIRIHRADMSQTLNFV